MDGMLTGNFDHKLKELRPSLWADRQRAVCPRHPDYPTCGLYDGHKFIMGVPQNYAPANSVAGVNMEQLLRFRKHDTIKYILDKGLRPEGSTIEERVLWRGYRMILAHLVRLKLIDKSKAEKLFDIEIQPNRAEFPRNFIQLNI